MRSYYLCKSLNKLIATSACCNKPKDIENVTLTPCKGVELYYTGNIDLFSMFPSKELVIYDEYIASVTHSLDLTYGKVRFIELSLLTSEQLLKLKYLLI